jgi:uncharacterized membrane protein YecN with MAPEG domain
VRHSRWTTIGGPAGVAVAIAVWLGIAWMLPRSDAAGAPEHMAQAFAALLPMGCVLSAMILVQMRQRARTGAVDPLAGDDGHLLWVNQRVLSNTVEQLAGFVPSLLALAAVSPAAWMRFVVAAALTFAVARLAFWAGYLFGPLTRAPGMAATFAVNVGTLLAAILLWLGWR